MCISGCAKLGLSGRREKRGVATSKAQSEISVMWDVSVWPSDPIGNMPSFNHIPGGGNVLYMDGHVDYFRCQERWPICSTWVALLGHMATLNNPYG